jgi:hypothetical protein
MRALEIIKEASVFTRGTYSYGHKVKAAANAEKGKKLAAAIKQVVPDFSENEELEWVEKVPKGTPIVPFSKSDNIRYFKRTNNTYIGLQGSDSSIESGIVHAGENIKFNKGDIAEGILGAAITAKLIKRGSDKIGTITPEDVKTVLANAVKNAGTELNYTVKDKNSSMADTISFTIKLNGPSLEIISNSAQWPKFESLFNSTAHYANTADAERYSNFFYANGKVDEIKISSDGLSGQKSRKTDVQAVVTTTDPVTGKTKERTLKNIDISLKADSSQFGQIGTGGLSGGFEKWMQSARKLFEPFGIVLDEPTKRGTKNNMVNFYVDMYKQAGDKLHQELTNASVNKETSFVEKIADVIFHQATLKVPNVRVVNLEKGESSIHSFAALKSRMLSAGIDLAASVSIGRSGYPTIAITDIKSNQVLVKIRYFSTKIADKTAHVFEKGPLLHQLTMITKKRTNAQPGVEPVQQPQPEIPVQQPQQAPKINSKNATSLKGNAFKSPVKPSTIPNKTTDFEEPVDI